MQAEVPFAGVRHDYGETGLPKTGRLKPRQQPSKVGLRRLQIRVPEGGLCASVAVNSLARDSPQILLTILARTLPLPLQSKRLRGSARRRILARESGMCNPESGIRNSQRGLARKL